MNSADWLKLYEEAEKNSTYTVRSWKNSMFELIKDLARLEGDTAEGDTETEKLLRTTLGYREGISSLSMATELVKQYQGRKQTTDALSLKINLLTNLEELAHKVLRESFGFTEDIGLVSMAKKIALQNRKEKNMGPQPGPNIAEGFTFGDQEDEQIFENLKEEINVFLFTRLPEETTLKEMEEIALEMDKLITHRWEVERSRKETS